MKRTLIVLGMLLAFVVFLVASVSAELPDPARIESGISSALPVLSESPGPSRAPLVFCGLAAAALALLTTLHFSSAVASNKLFANMKIRNKTSGDKSTAAVIEWLDMKGYSNFAALVTISVLSGTGVDAFLLVADAAYDGSDGNVTIKTHADPTTADALGDMLCLECTAEEIAQLGAAAGKDLRYVGVKLDLNSASDRCIVTEILAGPTFAKDGLTADIIGA